MCCQSMGVTAATDMMLACCGVSCCLVVQHLQVVVAPVALAAVAAALESCAADSSQLLSLTPRLLVISGVASSHV
jgi:hypothetical protein